eukprot:PRCOL_00001928-RA
MVSATFGDGGRQGARRGALEQSGGSKCKKQKKTFTQKVEMQEGGGKSCRSGGGKRGGQVKALRDLEKGGYMKRAARAEPTNRMFQMPPAVTNAFERNSAFLKRAFSLETLLRPLPSGLALGLERNLKFLGKSATQLFTGEGVANAKTAIGKK